MNRYSIDWKQPGEETAGCPHRALINSDLPAKLDSNCPFCVKEFPNQHRDTTNHVDHPTHYNSNPSGIECIDVVEHLTFNVGNAIKYCWRAGLKTDNKAITYQDVLSAHIKDLRKAEWYIRREISRLEKGLKSK